MVECLGTSPEFDLSGHFRSRQAEHKRERDAMITMYAEWCVVHYGLGCECMTVATHMHTHTYAHYGKIIVKGRIQTEEILFLFTSSCRYMHAPYMHIAHTYERQ